MQFIIHPQLVCKCSNGFNGANFQSLRADDQLCANPHHYALSVHRAFTDRIHLPPGFQVMAFHLGAPPKLVVRRRHGVYVFSILDPLNPPTSFDDDEDEDEAHDDEMMLKGSSILMSMPERRQTPALLHTMSSGSESSNEASSQRSEPPSAYNTLLLAIQLASDTSKQQEVPSSE